MNSYYKKKIERALLIQVPGVDRKDRFAPIGLLAVAKILQNSGIHVVICDMCIEDASKMVDIVKKTRFDLIGFGGIATSYGTAKEFSEFLHKFCPDSVYVAGGPLASTYDILLEDGVVDFSFHGEVEKSLPKFIAFLESGNGITDIGGISFLRKKLEYFEIEANSAQWFKQNDLICRTFSEKQMINLDDCGYPDYKLVDLDKYTLDLRDWYSSYKPGVDKADILKAKIERLLEQKKYKYLEIITTSRGCTHRCKFCYRHMQGVRRFSISYVINSIRRVKEHYDIDGIAFADELFNSDEGYVHGLCDALDGLNLGISFYMAGAMRVDKINAGLLRRMSKTGFIAVNFGQESGSDTVLKYYGKGVSRQQNINSVKLSEECGMHTGVQLVIGSPAETMKTIKETRDFLKAVDASLASINYIIPLPETPIWEEIIKKGYIKDVREYLNKVKKYAGSYKLGLNISRASKLVWVFWYIFLERAVFLNRHKHHFLKMLYYKTYCFKCIAVLSHISRALGAYSNKLYHKIRSSYA